MSKKTEVHFKFDNEEDYEISNLLSFMLEVSREEITAIVLGSLRTDYRYILCGNMVFVQNPPGHWRKEKATIYARGASARESHFDRYRILTGTEWHSVSQIKTLQ